MKLLLTPEAAGYSAAFGEEVIRTQLEGGSGRYRADMLNSSSMVECSWTLTAAQYNYLAAFYRTHKKGAVPFEIDLILDSAEKVERVANFMPNTFQLTGQSGPNYFVKATLEVQPMAIDAAADLAIVNAFS